MLDDINSHHRPSAAVIPSALTVQPTATTQAAKYTFGDWAAKGLSLSATWADNVSNYLSTKCYKVMLCDPKDLGRSHDVAIDKTIVSIFELYV